MKIDWSLARADATDSTLSNLTLVFLSLLVLGVTAFLGFLIVRGARLRHPRQTETFGALAVLWIALTAGSGIYDIVVQSKWSQESAARLQSGYYSPTEVNADAPHHPWPLYIISGVGYGVLLIAVNRSRTRPS